MEFSADGSMSTAIASFFASQKIELGKVTLQPGLILSSSICHGGRTQECIPEGREGYEAGNAINGYVHSRKSIRQGNDWPSADVGLIISRIIFAARYFSVILTI